MSLLSTFHWPEIVTWSSSTAESKWLGEGGQAGITIDTVYVPRTTAVLLQKSNPWTEPGYTFLTVHLTTSLHLSIISSTSIIARREFLDNDH